MTDLSSPRVKTIKRLFAVSGNQCAFPNCSELLVEPVSGKVTGEVCHICAASEGGPRFDSTQTAEERHGFTNLLLMCRTHHSVIDDDELSYTVERLVGLKQAHESSATPVAEPSDEVAGVLIAGVVADTVAGDVVVSVNQHGGQTAHTIQNFGPPKRSISPDARKRMLDVLRRVTSSVAFASTQGDPEAAEFKTQLMEVFAEAGWDVRDQRTFMFFGHKTGLVVTIPFDASEDGLAQVVAEALAQSGESVSGNRGDMANEAGIYVQVWHSSE